MRGTRSGPRPASRGSRFIPAHAGNTRATAHKQAALPVHPRACGEHSEQQASVDAEAGSSPRMRGTRADAGRGRLGRRFIPAHAGNTRGCIRNGGKPDGSSPRMRGTRSPTTCGRATCWFIPAHAGNTSLSLPPEIPSTVHPRACGEHRLRAFGTCSVTGSSPRMRGTHLRGNFRRQAARFIPAHAGNTVANGPARSGSSVHPRACGEHIGNLETMREMGGSSPRMRGTPM